MLKPEWYDNNGRIDRINQLYEQLETFILKDISRRLLSAGEMTGTADRLIWKLQQMGESRRMIEDKLSRIMGISRYELKKLLQDAAMTSWNYDAQSMAQWAGNNAVKSPLKNPEIMRLMDAQWKKTQGEMQNLTRTTAIQASGDLGRMLDEADMRVNAGAQSYNAAISDVLDRYAGQGIMVDYPSGTRRTLEAAVRCAVVTSAAQMAGQMTAQYIKENDIHLVLTSAHTGARVRGKNQPKCAGHDEWQGRVFCIDGTDKRYPDLEENTGYRIDRETGVGTAINPLGLLGYNCRHAVQPFREGMKNPWRDKDGNLLINGKPYDSEENRKRFEELQKQRYMERSIRATKRKLIEKQEQINAAGTDVEKAKRQSEYDRMAHKLTEKNKAYNDYCKSHGLKPLYDRTKLGDFKYKQEKAANAGAKRYMELSDPVAKSADSGIIKERNIRNVESGGKRNEDPLNEEQIEEAKSAIRNQGYTGQIIYSEYSNTAFHGSAEGDKFNYMVIGTDIYPNKNGGKIANERISVNGCAAHEVVGHYETWEKGTALDDTALDEAQASIRASKFGVGLSDEEREILLEDAMDRLNAAGIDYDEVKRYLDIWER